MKADVTKHMQLARMLIDGANESMSTWDDKERMEKGWYGYICTDPVHSKESVVRRLIQARQELLQVIRVLNK